MTDKLRTSQRAKRLGPVLRHTSGNPFLYFLFHKPLHVICSTVDSAAVGIAGQKNWSKKKLVKGFTHSEAESTRGVENLPLCAEQTQQRQQGQQQEQQEQQRQSKCRVPRATVYDLLREAGFPPLPLVGRLDSESTGLMLLTDDTDLLRAVLSPKPPPELSDTKISCREKKYNFKSKTYCVVLLAPPTLNLKNVTKQRQHEIEEELAAEYSFQKQNVTYSTSKSAVKITRRWQDPLLIPGGDRNKSPENFGWCLEVEVRLSEGKHHQIRRMASRSGYTVVSLTRTAIGSMTLQSVPTPGSAQWLLPEDVTALRESFDLTPTPLNLELKLELN